MSPTPARTSRTRIVEAARALLEEGGTDAVTMATVAKRVGVQPPSLYKHIRDRAALLDAVATDAAEELGRTMIATAAEAGTDPAARVAALAHAYRAFAHRSPRSAAVLFADTGHGTGAPVHVAARAAAPVIEATARLVGPEAALPAARVMTSFAYGFTTMEQAGAFQLGGDVEVAYRLGVRALVRGLAAVVQDTMPDDDEASPTA